MFCATAPTVRDTLAMGGRVPSHAAELDRLYPTIAEARRRVDRAAHVVVATCAGSGVVLLVPSSKAAARRAIDLARRANLPRIACELRDGLCIIGVR